MEEFESNQQPIQTDSEEIETPPTPESPLTDSPYVVEVEETAALEVPASVPSQKPAKGRGVWKVLICSVLIVALIAGSCFATAYVLNGYWQGKNQQTITNLMAQIDRLEELIHDNSFTGNGNSVSGTPNEGISGGMTPAQVYAQNVKSVVAIAANQVTTNAYGQTSEAASSGSGFIISQDGYIVTNYHVVEGATTLKVITYNGTEYTAEFIGGDEPNDLAVLKIDTQDLPAVTLGSSDDLIVGDQVVAIGNPLGELTSTLTVGYVSAKDRDINTSGALINMIQTDAAINPGNSGGPLFNMKGEVVGITTAKYSGTTSSGASIEGIGFAIPLDDVVKKITDLRDKGYISAGYLGVMVQDTDPRLSMYGIPAGAYVVEVSPGYAAYRAGILAKDIIVSVDGHEVGGLNDLSFALQYYEPGQTVIITVWRSGQLIELEACLDQKPADIS